MASDVQTSNKTVELSTELQEFCSRLGILAHVPVMIDLVEQSFPTLNRLELSAEEDPETGEEWLVVDATMNGQGVEFLDQYRSYIDRKVRTIPWPLSDRIRLSYHFVS